MKIMEVKIMEVAKMGVKTTMKKMIKAICAWFCVVGVAFGAIDDFKTASWNLQGSSATSESKWSVSVRQLISGENAADILALQEAGSLPQTATQTQRTFQTPPGIPIAEYTWDLGSRSRPDMVYIYYSPVDVGANRVNLAIVSRRMADDVIVLPPPTTVSRPIIGIRIGNDVFFSIHALANGGRDAPAIVNAVFNHFSGRSDINWMILGDFNRSPASLRLELSLETRVRIAIVAPNIATQRSGGILDYAVIGNSGSGFREPLIAAALMLANFRTQLVSDHFPVNFRRFPPN